MTEDTPRTCGLVDTTLRDGEQAPGVAFTAVEKEHVARALARIGVEEIEAGVPAMGICEQEELKNLACLGLPCRITAWCRARLSDLQAALKCGVDGVHFSLPLSELHLRALGKDRDWVRKAVQEAAEFALDHFGFVSVGAQDASRTEPAFLEEMAVRAGELGVHRFRLADTVGIWSPFKVLSVFKRLQSLTACGLGFHGHNDLGLATANTLAAMEGGAAWVDVTVGGLGERAGNAPLEEVVMASEVALGRDGGVHTPELMDLAKLVADMAGRPIPLGKAIVGSHAFTHESGIHCQVMLREQRSYEPFAPERIGRQGRSFVVGKHSGRAILGHVLGLSAEETGQLTPLLSQVRHRATQRKCGLSLDELRQEWEMLTTGRKSA